MLKKGGTLFFLHNDRMVWNNRLEVSPEYFPIGDITKEVWREHKEAISFYMGHITLESIFQQENANLLLSFLGHSDVARGRCRPGISLRRRRRRRRWGAVEAPVVGRTPGCRSRARRGDNPAHAQQGYVQRRAAASVGTQSQPPPRPAPTRRSRAATA